MDPNVAYDQLSRYFAFPENGYVRNRRAAEARGAAGKYGADERLRRGPRAVAGSPGCGREPASGQPLVEGQMVRTVRATTRMMAEAERLNHPGQRSRGAIRVVGDLGVAVYVTELED